MPSRDDVVPVDQLLAAARQRVAEVGLRVAANEIGVEFSSLNKLLGGGRSPRASTRAKLTTWYLARAAVGELEDPSELLEVGLTILAAYFPENIRDQVREQLRGDLAQIAQTHNTVLPQRMSAVAKSDRRLGSSS